ncbi:MAG: sortase B protein-sorting domain-containing protein, partial [Clostridia bacterium]|nr:sortase B protein-sorting domain-containing protein [Clostridia bacterium]
PALKEIGMDTAAEITGALNKAAAGKGYDAKNSVTMDVQLQMKTVGDDGKEKWVTVTEENFPAEGVEVAFDLPAGTNATDYEFVIAHMLTTGKNAGKVELLTPTVKDGKLVAKFTSLSPVSISWKTTLKPSTLPKTGDASNIALWMMLLTVTAAAVICLKRKTVNS